jgi:hypothetical protein
MFALHGCRLAQRSKPSIESNRASFIRYRSDSNGQGVHAGNLSRMSPFPGSDQVATNILANILLLEEAQPSDLGDSKDRGSRIEWFRWQDRTV